MQFKGTGNLLVKDLDTKRGIVQAYWSAFGNKDDGGDIVMPGNWAKSIKERGPRSSQPRIKFLYQHDEKMLVSKPDELAEDAFGLLATCTIPPTTLGKDILLLYEFSILTEHSVGYETVQAQWDAKASARLLIESILWEGSGVTWGMNAATPVVAVKALMQPSYLTSLAERAQKIDKLLHHGDLRTATLCETLDRELKSLHTALTPAHEAERPYSIKGVMDSMNELARRLEAKGASGKTTWPLGARDAAWDGGAAHKRIVAWATKADDTVDTAKMQSVHFYSPDGDDAQDVSKYKLLYCDQVDGEIRAMPRAIFACAGSHGVDGTTGISADDEASIKSKIETWYAKMRKQFDDDTIVVPWDDGAKGADMGKRLIKSADGEIEVSADGTHGSFTGTHTHAHKAMGSQGDDDQHEHAHTHTDDGQHSHEHEKAAAPKAAPSVPTRTAPNGRTIRKARDFGTLFASLNESDQLQDDWGDTFIAFVQAMWELMCQSQYQQSDYLPEGTEEVDIAEAAQHNVDAFGKAVMTLVDRSIAADFVPAITCDMDQFIDPDGPNADDDDMYGEDDGDAVTIFNYSKSRRPQRMSDAPARLGKAGRAIGSANREVITKALDGMSEAMKAMQSHHGAIADLMTKTDPDHTRQDEDNVLGDDDTANGGTNPQKHRRFVPRHAPERQKAATTHGFDLSALDSTLDALRSRTASGGKAY